jgi:hypothetical protein
MSRRLVTARCRDILQRASLGLTTPADQRVIAKLFWLWRKHGEPTTGHYAGYRIWQLRLERVALERALWSGTFRDTWPAELARARKGQPAGWDAARFRQAYLAWVAAGRQPHDVLTLPAQQHLQLEETRRTARRAPATAPPAKTTRRPATRRAAPAPDALLAALGDAAA